MRELLRLEDVRVSYGPREILKAVNLAIGEGEFCALLGLNGSGKTTLLRAVCGLLPLKGRCVAAEQDCRGLHERQRARLMAFIPQAASLSGGRSVLDVVLMGFNARLGLLASPSAEHRRIAEGLLERVGLLPEKDRDFGMLSHGQKQMVLLARCMAQDTPLLLMDEPDSALDFQNRHRMLGQLRELIHTGGRAGLITMHDPNFAMAYCDRLFLLRDGRIEGELSMTGAAGEEIRQKLALLYGDVQVLPYSGGFLMARAEPCHPDGGRV